MKPYKAFASFLSTVALTALIQPNAARAQELLPPDSTVTPIPALNAEYYYNVIHKGLCSPTTLSAYLDCVKAAIKLGEILEQRGETLQNIDPNANGTIEDLKNSVGQEVSRYYLRELSGAFENIKSGPHYYEGMLAMMLHFKGAMELQGKSIQDAYIDRIQLTESGQKIILQSADWSDAFFRLREVREFLNGYLNDSLNIIDTPVGNNITSAQNALDQFEKEIGNSGKTLKDTSVTDEKLTLLLQILRMTSVAHSNAFQAGSDEQIIEKIQDNFEGTLVSQQTTAPDVAFYHSFVICINQQINDKAKIGDTQKLYKLGLDHMIKDMTGSLEKAEGDYQKNAPWTTPPPPAGPKKIIDVAPGL